MMGLSHNMAVKLPVRSVTIHAFARIAPARLPPYGRRLSRCSRKRLPPMTLKDTSGTAHGIQLSILRAMTGSQRLMMALEMSEAAVKSLWLAFAASIPNGPKRN